MEYHSKRANNLFGLSFFNIMNFITTFLSVPLRYIHRLRLPCPASPLFLSKAGGALRREGGQRKTGLESAYEVSAPHC